MSLYNILVKHMLDGGIPINTTFSHAGFLKRHIANNTMPHDYNYQEPEDRKILIRCKKHIKHHAKELSDTVIMMIHPFHLPLRLHKYVDRNLGDLAKYFENIGRLIAKPDASIVIADTMHLYTSTTSMLLEAGLIEGAILTRYDSGMLSSRRDYKLLRDKRIYICGGYNGSHINEKIGCLTGFLEDMPKKLHRNVYPLEGCILESPQLSKHRILAERVYYRDHSAFASTATIQEIGQHRISQYWSSRQHIRDGLRNIYKMLMQLAGCGKKECYPSLPLLNHAIIARSRLC